jgi:rod shape-determining protein MreD
MGSFLSLPILALAAALQVSVVPQFTIFGGRPDLIFLLVVTWSLNSTLEEAVVWVFVGGIMKDLLSINPVGTSIVGMLLVVFAIHLIRQQMYQVGVISLVWIALLGTFVQLVTTLLILLVMGLRPARTLDTTLVVLLREITYVLPATIVYNLVFIFPVYWFVRRIQRRVSRDRRLFR